MDVEPRVAGEEDVVHEPAPGRAAHAGEAHAGLVALLDGAAVEGSSLKFGGRIWIRFWIRFRAICPEFSVVNPDKFDEIRQNRNSNQ